MTDLLTILLIWLLVFVPGAVVVSGLIRYVQRPRRRRYR